MNYNIREMKLDDINDVIKGETIIFGESLGYDMLYTEISLNPYAYYFVLESNDKIIGYIGVWIDEEHSEIINFYILPEYQNKGFGSKMLEFIISLVRMSKVPTISLEVRESNLKAKSLYKKYGFVYSHKRENYYSNHEDAEVMILEV